MFLRSLRKWIKLSMSEGNCRHSERPPLFNALSRQGPSAPIRGICHSCISLLYNVVCRTQIKVQVLKHVYYLSIGTIREGSFAKVLFENDQNNGVGWQGPVPAALKNELRRSGTFHETIGNPYQYRVSPRYVNLKKGGPLPLTQKKVCVVKKIHIMITIIHSPNVTNHPENICRKSTYLTKNCI